MALEVTQILQLIHRTACGTQAFAPDIANTLKQSQMKKLSNAPEMGDKFLKKFSRRCDCILYTVYNLYVKEKGPQPTRYGPAQGVRKRRGSVRSDRFYLFLTSIL